MNNTIPKSYGKEYLTMGIAQMPPGPHLTWGDINKWRDSLKVGDVIKARLIVKMDCSSGYIIPRHDVFNRPLPGAILHNHPFVVRKVYPSQIELETVDDRGESWICYATTRYLYMRKGMATLYGIRKVS